MKGILFIIPIMLLSCAKMPNKQHFCADYQKVIEASEMEIEKLFQENGKLKEEYESANEYIQLLEQENEYLKNVRDSIRYSFKN